MESKDMDMEKLKKTLLDMRNNILADEVYGGNQKAFMQFLEQAKGFNADDLSLGTSRRAEVLAFAESWFQRAVLLSQDKKRFVILNNEEWKRKE